MERMVLKKKNGVVVEMNLTPSLSQKLETDDSLHLCWNNCKNACVTKCPKVEDRIKETIDEYDFITDGFQIIDENGDVDRFKVTGCEKYEEAEKRELTAEEQRRARRLKESILTTYFDTATVEEAYIEQYIAEQLGELKSIHGRRLPEATIIEKISLQPGGEETLRKIIEAKREKVCVTKHEKEVQEASIRLVEKAYNRVKTEREERESAFNAKRKEMILAHKIKNK